MGGADLEKLLGLKKKRGFFEGRVLWRGKGKTVLVVSVFEGPFSEQCGHKLGEVGGERVLFSEFGLEEEVPSERAV